jgi:chemotaxis protein CheY-P-specific phosphatase CheC
MHDRVSEAGRNLTSAASKKMQDMVGNGYKRKKRKKKRQSGSSVKRSKVSKKKSYKKKVLNRKPKERDIFS